MAQENVFIQCGLNTAFEYAFLAAPDFKVQAIEKKRVESKYYCPMTLLSSEKPYTVIGIDFNKQRNEVLRRHYQDNPCIHIWDYVIWHEDLKNFKHSGSEAVEEYTVEYMRKTNDFIHPVDETPPGAKNGWKDAITLNTLFSKIFDIKGLANANIRGMHLNIESSEYNALKGIDWETFPYPEIMRIATRHGAKKSPKIHDYCMRTMQEHGYVIYPDHRDKREFFTFFRL